MKKIKLYLLNRIAAPIVATIADIVFIISLVLKLTISPIVIIVIAFAGEKIANMLFKLYFGENDKKRTTKKTDKKK